MVAVVALILASSDALLQDVTASPVVVGGGAVAAALYGKLQRAESVFGSGLSRPFLVASEQETKAVDKVLWRSFCMASVMTADALSREAFVARRGRVDTAGAPLYFLDATGFDAASSRAPALKLPWPFAAPEAPEAVTASPRSAAPVDVDLLRTLANSGNPDAHAYVLAADVACAASWMEALDEVPSLSATIVAPAEGVGLVADAGWASKRPQDLEGELSTSVSVAPGLDDPDATPTGGLQVEDLAEVAIQCALRLPREPCRVVRVAGGGQLSTRPNANYFAQIGGELSKAREGDVDSVDWVATLAALGEPVRDLRA